ncbi:AMP-binding protein [Pseudomonas sp.]|uniref:AMP-binding protein n=1 Tax=Pseudomonas sp. TaxID=306 RepID=UPI00260C121F|nr:AMP-binding protein [Pseudomonas sp.]
MKGILSPIAGVIYPAAQRAKEYFANGAWVDKTVGQVLRETATKHPERIAFVCDGESLTFEQLDTASERLGAALLRLGIRTGDRAIFQLGTSLETVIVLMACFKAGIIAVCSLPQHREVEIGQLANKTLARAYFVQADFGRHDLVTFALGMMAQSATLKHLIIVRGESSGLGNFDSLMANMPLESARELLSRVKLGSEDVLSFQLSGGTTGTPKVIPRFHAEYLGQSHDLAKLYQVDEHSKVIWSLPLLHNAGQLYALLPPLLFGITTVLMSKVDIPVMLDLIEMHQVTHALSIGPVAPQLLAYQYIQKHDLSSLRMFATMSRSEILEAHLNVPCSNLYGLTEGLLFGAAPDAPTYVRHQTQGSSGCRYDELRLLDPESETPVGQGQMGELCFRGPSSLIGYFDDPIANTGAFTSDGFYRSGDMMTAHIIDGVTHYTFEGRLRDNVNRGGEKIGCEEVESFVCRHPAIADAKLVAMPDPIYGEKGCIFIIPRNAAVIPDLKQLSDFLVGQGLAKYKSPERIELIDTFPITKVGKLDKPALKRILAERVIGEETCMS